MLPDRGRAAAGHRHDPVVHASRCRAGTPSRSPGTTSARPGRPPSRSSRSRWRTASPTSRSDRARARRRRLRPAALLLLQPHIDFFEEIAKFRAARRIWAREMRDNYGAKKGGVMRLRFHTQTAGVVADRAAAAQQHRPHHHRGAGGGARRHPVAAHQLLRRGAGAADRGRRHGGAADAADPRRRDRRRRTPIDPLGGSWFVERLTDEMEAAAYGYFARIDELGGMVEAIRPQLPPARDRRRLLPLPAGAGDERSGSSSASTTSPRTTKPRRRS